MNIAMDPSRTIYAAIDSMLSLVAPDKAIMASVHVCATLTTDPKVTKSRFVHFIFDRPRSRYTAVYWASPQQREAGPHQIETWQRSAYHDSVQVVGEGIDGPLYEAAQQLLEDLDGDWGDYEIEASWLLGQPRPIKLEKVSKFSKKEFDFRYKIETEAVLF